MTTEVGIGEGEQVAAARGWAERLDRALERRAIVVVGLALLAYGLLAAWHSASKRIWYDEWFTYEIARLPDLGQFIRALGEGSEQTPPLDYLLSRASLALLGDGAWGLRAPSVAGVGVMLACLYAVVARRLGPLYAWGAVLVALTGPAWFFATEARSYALVLGFSAAALLCWQRAEPGGSRRPALAGLTFGIAGAVSSHYFATICLIPLGLGQLVRSWRLRRVDAPAWAALVLGGAVVLLYVPLVLQKRGFIGTFWARPAWAMLPGMYEYFIGLLAVPLAWLLVGWGAGLGRVRPPAEDSPSARASGFLVEERAAALGFVLLPVFGLLLAKAFLGLVDGRYLITTVFGFAMLLPACIARATRGAAAGGLALAVVLGCWFGLDEGGKLLKAWKYPPPAPGPAAAAFFDGAGRSEPILIADEKVYFDAFHEWPADLAARLIYVTERPPNMLDPVRLIQPFLSGVRVESIGDRETAHQPVLVYTTLRDEVPSQASLPALIASGAEIRLIASHGDQRLYRATWSPRDPR
ncbi:MAG: glycosyltransferase family 39 protein [Isosphaeraceae bacterium]|jgi:4-amino-4-deoxy-L-arabinose transferase-like glycosyltransferase